MTNLKPLPGRALIELSGQYGAHVYTEEKKYDMHTHGVCRSLIAATKGKTNSWSDPDVVELNGKTVFWMQFKEGEIIERDGKKYTFVKIEDLDGYEENDQS